MKFPYHAEKIHTDHGITLYRPLIDIVIRNHDARYPLLALIDSGADGCLFPHGIGAAIGLDIKSGIKIGGEGVGSKIVVYLHDVHLIIGGHEVKARCGFTESIQKCLLGQAGFFENFDVKFLYRKKEIEIFPAKILK